jgi:hypothetical protein
MAMDFAVKESRKNGSHDVTDTSSHHKGLLEVVARFISNTPRCIVRLLTPCPKGASVSKLPSDSFHPS